MRLRTGTNAGARGYTSVEVLVAITLLMIGAVGVMSMQRASIQGNLEARQMDLATQIARGWSERLLRDGASWTGPNPTTTISNLGNTKYLNLVSTSPGSWVLPNVPSGAGDGASPAYDMLGRDLASGDPAEKFTFCTQLRFDWLITNEVMRAEIRVFWPRKLLTAPPASFCSSGNTTVGATNATSIYHFVYMTVPIRQNASQ
jgi:type II secretory pathway pseudopilin PulG